MAYRVQAHPSELFGGVIAQFVGRPGMAKLVKSDARNERPTLAAPDNPTFEENTYDLRVLI